MIRWRQYTYRYIRCKLSEILLHKFHRYILRMLKLYSITNGTCELEIPVPGISPIKRNVWACLIYHLFDIGLRSFCYCCSAFKFILPLSSTCNCNLSFYCLLLLNAFDDNSIYLLLILNWIWFDLDLKLRMTHIVPSMEYHNEKWYTKVVGKLNGVLFIGLKRKRIWRLLSLEPAKSEHLF